MIRTFFRNCSGATATEHALIAAFIAMAAMAFAGLAANKLYMILMIGAETTGAGFRP